MFKLVAVVAVLLIIIVAALAIFVATRPKSFRFERRTRIKAPPPAVFALIQDFHNWRRWSPWEDLDPALKRDYGGAARGVGAVYGWEGNNKAGTGRMEITLAAAPSQVVVDLQFIKPFKARNTAEFTITPTEDGSEVVWAMYGPNSTVGKIMSLFMSMDAMLGKSFDEGLARMKAAAEG